MGDLSPHFSAKEFACHGFGRSGHPWHEIGRPVTDLLDVLEALRAQDGRPLRVLSGHRCPWWNHRVRGAEHSQHLRRTAADLEGGRFTEDDARRAGATGIGLRAGWVVHVDTRRPRWSRVTTWTYD